VTAPVVVVGAGLTGAAAAWRLAQRGRAVVLVEAETPAHAGGSSHGSARIFRHAYDDPFWVGLTVQALRGWRQLEEASGRSVLATTGGLDAGHPGGLAAIAAALAVHGVASELVTPGAAAERWPHLSLDGPVLHQAAAGVVDAAVAVHAMVGEAQRHGAQVLLGDRVTAVERRGDGALVHLEAGSPVPASAVVVAAGAWLPELAIRLPPGVAERLPPFVVTQQQVFHFPFPVAPPSPSAWPVLVHRGSRVVYAMPGGRDAGDAGFKIAEHDGGTRTTASTRDGVVDPVSRARVVDFVRRFLPAVDPVPYAEATCLYTSTEHEDFVIDRVGPIVVASPCSGHGAKFAPLVGELVADAATGTGSAPARFRLPAAAR
jgi:sarcosine oxidase